MMHLIWSVVIAFVFYSFPNIKWQFCVGFITASHGEFV